MTAFDCGEDVLGGGALDPRLRACIREMRMAETPVAKLVAIKRELALIAPTILDKQAVVDALMPFAEDVGLIKEVGQAIEYAITHTLSAHERSNGYDEVEILWSPWWRDPKTIPPREFLYSRHYIRGAIGATIGAGGRAKTTLSHFEAVSMVIGRDLATGEKLAAGRLRVLCLNAEENQDEIDRRIAAICQCYGVSEHDLGGRLFAISVRDRPLRLATMVNAKPTLDGKALAQLREFINCEHIDVFMLDPFVSFHAVVESDNMHMDLVIKQGLGAIANETNSAGEIFHHPGKPKPGQAETLVEDGRGASAILWAVRSARVLNFMTPDEAAKLGISEDDRRQYIRIANGKANMGPVGKAEWINIEVETLPNGDNVAVASRWTPPNPFDGVSRADMEVARKLAATGEFRADRRSPKWFGYPLAAQLHLAVSAEGETNPKDLARLQTIIKTWLKNKVIETEERKDSEGKDRKFIVAGSFRPEPPMSTPDDEYTIQ